MNGPDPGAAPGGEVSARWADWRARVDLEEYATRWQRQAAAGFDVNGEADLVASFAPASVLDAGCGAGRVAIELARRGVDVVGVDLDADLLAHARLLAPTLTWCHADLASLDLGRCFDVIIQAGNVLNFCRPEARSAIIARAVEHLEPGGRLIAGFEIEPEPGHAGGTNLAHVLDLAGTAGLDLDAQWSTWERDRLEPGGRYVVLNLRRPGVAARRSSSGPSAGGPGSG